MLQKGQAAPEFEIMNQNGEMVRLSDFTGTKNIVLYFYPKDDTPGCTVEASQFTALIDDFDRSNTVVLGISKDTEDCHRHFIHKYGLKIDLLADTRGEMCQQYGVWQEKEKDGVKKMGIVRSTFIVDRQGQIVYAEYGVDPQGHAEAMLGIVNTL